MRSGLVTILVLIILGTMLAEVVTNPTGTKQLTDGFIQFWQTSMNGLLGQTSTGTRAGGS